MVSPKRTLPSYGNKDFDVYFGIRRTCGTVQFFENVPFLVLGLSFDDLSEPFFLNTWVIS
jgi:hypothetical protein